MKKLVFATHNAHKLQEIKALLKNLEVISLTDIGCKEEIEETAETLEGNAKIKANYGADVANHLRGTSYYIV